MAGPNRTGGAQFLHPADLNVPATRYPRCEPSTPGARSASAHQTGDPKGRYCASLGHKQDDESGLVYMRARYYEPGSGRFISEDYARDGYCYFTYCNNNPVNYTDQSGKSTGIDGLYQFIGMFAAVGGFMAFATIATLLCSGVMSIIEAAETARLAMVAYIIADVSLSKSKGMRILGALMAAGIDRLLDSIASGAKAGSEIGGLCRAAIIGVTAYSLMLVGEMAESIIEDGPPGSN